MKIRSAIPFVLLLGVFIFSISAGYAQKASAEYISKIKPARLKSGEQIYDGIKNVFYQDQKLYVTNIWAGLQIVDVSDPAHPRELGSYTTENRSHNSVVENGLAFLSSELYGVQVLDVSNPAAPKKVGRIRTKGDVQWVISSAPYIYTAEGARGIAVYDVSDLSAPKAMGHYDTPGFAWGLFLDGTDLYVADKSGGVTILDVSDVSNPKRLGQFADMRNAKTIQVENGIAYVSNGADGLWILDVGNKAFPKLMARVPADGFIFDAFKFGSNVFLANETKKRLDIIGVADPANPVVEGSYQGSSKMYSSWKNDVIVYVAADSNTIILRHNHPPYITPIADVTVDENTPLVITPEAGDPDGDAISFSAGHLPPDAHFDAATGVISWTPTYDQSGVYPGVTISVTEQTESKLSSSTTFDIKVKHVNRPPTLADVGDTTINEEQKLSFVIPEGQDPDVEDKGRLKYRAENMPDGAVFNPTLRMFSWTPTYEQSGVYTVDFVVEDPAGGLMRDGATITVNHVDRKPLLSEVKPQVTDENKEVTFTLKGSDADKEDQDKLSYAAENLPEGAVFDPAKATFSWTPTYDQSGVYDGLRFIFKAGALADTIPVSITVNHVNRPPVMQPVAMQSVNENDTLSFTLTVSDPDVEDAGKLVVTAANLPEGAAFDGETLTFIWQPNFEQSGVYDKISFTVSDPSGLKNTQPVSITVNHVNRPPTLEALAGVTVDENNPVTITLVGSDPDIEDKSNLSYSVDNLPQGAVLEGNVFKWTPGYDQSGTYPLTFTASDGRLSVSQSMTITVNHVNRPPVLENIVAQTVDENVKLEFTVKGSDPDTEDAGKTTLSAANLPQGATFDAQSGLFSWTPTFDQSGEYTVTFTISDPQQASASQDVPVTVNHVNRTPEFPAQAAQTTDENSTLTFTLLPATDPDKEDADKLVYSAAGLPPGATFDAATHTFNWTPGYDQAGEYTVTFTVSDGAFTVEQPVTIKINNVNLAPELGRFDNPQIDENQSWSMALDVKDPDKEDSGKLKVTVTNLPQGAAFDEATRTLSWTPGYDQAGDYAGIQVEVTDVGGLKDALSFDIKVNNVNRAPEIKVPGSQQVDENKSLAFSVSASDPDREDADKLTITMGDAPGGASFDGGNFSWTPGFDQAGEYTITFTVSDGETETSAPVQITVNNVNRAPEIDGPGSGEVQAGSSLSLAFTGSDPDGDKLNYTLSGAPSGMTVSTDGTVSWTPADDVSGDYSVTITVSDGSEEASKSFDVRVTPKPAPAPPDSTQGQ